MRRNLARWVIVLAVVMSIGCGGDPPPTDVEDGTDAGGADTPDMVSPDGAEATVETDRVLEPGGVAFTNRVGLGVSRESLDRPVAISSGVAGDPTTDAPLPPEATAVGEFLEVDAGRNVDISGDQAPLYLALPIPGGVDVSNLGLAVLGSVRDVPMHGAAGKESTWSVVSGMVAREEGLFVVPIRFLTAANSTVVLVESSQYDAPTLPGASESGTDRRENGLLDSGQRPVQALRQAVDAADQFLESGTKRDGFHVMCRGFQQGDCGSADKDEIRRQLKSARSDFSSGFRAPALRRTLPGRTVGGEKGQYYRYVIRPANSSASCTGGKGRYSPLTRVGVTCYDSSNDSPAESVTRSIYVNAVQFNFPFFHWSRLDERTAWLLEGPAAFAGSTQSGASSAVRWDRDSGSSKDLRNVDAALPMRTGQDPFPAAGTQDFWVFLINRRNSSPKEVLEPLWNSKVERAPGIQEVDATFDLTEEHWAWVRNQAFEARVRSGNSDLNDPCVPDPDAWGELHDTLTYDATNRRVKRDIIELTGDWEAGVVKVKVKNGYANKDVRASFGGTSDAGYLKLYPDRSSGGEECRYRNEAPSNTGESAFIEAGDSWSAYLLIANSPWSESDKRTYDVGLSIDRPNSDQESPSVAIKRPRAVNRTLRLNTLYLEADASDPGGGYLKPLEWTVEGSGGTTATYTGNDLAIEDFWSEGFQAGTFTISVEAVDDDGQESTVTFEADIEKKN